MSPECTMNFKFQFFTSLVRVRTLKFAQSEAAFTRQRLKTICVYTTMKYEIVAFTTIVKTTPENDTYKRNEMETHFKVFRSRVNGENSDNDWKRSAVMETIPRGTIFRGKYLTFATTGAPARTNSN